MRRYRSVLLPEVATEDIATEDIPRHTVRPTGARAEAREQAILDAALELVKEVGYDRLSMDALAERAHAGKATIYRHWSGKAEVVVEAIRRRKCEAAIPSADTGPLRNDLVATLSSMHAAITTEDSVLLVGVLSAMHKDPELAALMRRQVIDSKRTLLDEILERAIGRQELAVGSRSEVANEVLSSLFFSRLVIAGQPIDGAFIDHVVDDVILPLLRC
jgi:AcrR family transcriptional regulator